MGQRPGPKRRRGQGEAAGFWGGPSGRAAGSWPDPGGGSGRSSGRPAAHGGRAEPAAHGGGTEEALGWSEERARGRIRKKERARLGK